MHPSWSHSPQRNTKIVIFCMPTLFLFLMFTTLTILPWYTGIILAMALFFGMHHVSSFTPRESAMSDAQQIVTRVLLDKSNYTDSVTQSPYFAGIITASIIWVTYAWVSRLMNRKSRLLPRRSVADGTHRDTITSVHQPDACYFHRTLCLQLLPRHHFGCGDMSKTFQ